MFFTSHMRGPPMSTTTCLVIACWIKYFTGALSATAISFHRFLNVFSFFDLFNRDRGPGSQGGRPCFAYPASGHQLSGLRVWTRDEPVNHHWLGGQTQSSDRSRGRTAMSGNALITVLSNVSSGRPVRAANSTKSVSCTATPDPTDRNNAPWPRR